MKKLLNIYIMNAPLIVLSRRKEDKLHSEIYIQINFPEFSLLIIYLNKPILHPIFDCLHLMGMLKIIEKPI